MDRPTEGCCATCAFLSRRIKIPEAGAPRSHRNYDEVEQHERDLPNMDVKFVPAGAGAYLDGEYGCYRHRANLVKEIRAAVVLDVARVSAAVPTGELRKQRSG